MKTDMQYTDTDKHKVIPSLPGNTGRKREGYDERRKIIM